MFKCFDTDVRTEDENLLEKGSTDIVIVNREVSKLFLVMQNPTLECSPDFKNKYWRR